MERFTEHCGDRVQVKKSCDLYDGSIIARLAAYEDTGLEPENILDLLVDASTVAKTMNAKAALDEGVRKLFRKALDTYVAEAQTLMVFEEFSELQKELCKHSRGKDNRMEIAEEIADVQIMLEQMIILHNCADEVQEFRLAKLIRLDENLEGAGE